MRPSDRKQLHPRVARVVFIRTQTFADSSFLIASLEKDPHERIHRCERGEVTENQEN